MKTPHQHSFNNKEEIQNSLFCGCFYCKTIHKATKITTYTQDKNPTTRIPNTALCPKCGIDSVIGDKSGYPVTDIAWLAELHKKYFT